MEPWLEKVITIFIAVMASSGFWAFIQHKADQKDSRTKMILGLGHDRIVSLCNEYIERGWISSDEYENLYKYLYKPYEEMGGNGSAKRLMAIVNNLPVKERFSK